MTKTIPPHEDTLTTWRTWCDFLTFRVRMKVDSINLPALTTDQAKELGQALIDNAWEVDAAKPLESS